MNKILICLLFLAVNAVAQTVRYVSYNIGYDTNTGVNVTGIDTGPWATIDYTQDGGNGLASGNVIIYIDEGTYAELVTVDTYGGGGSVNYYFQYIGAPELWGNTGAVIIDGGGSRDKGFSITKASCSVTNLEIKAQYHVSSTCMGIYSGAFFTKIERCTVHSLTGKYPVGMFLANSCGNIVRNNLIYNILPSVTGGYVIGIWASNAYGYFENNTIYNVDQNSPTGQSRGGMKIQYQSDFGSQVMYVRNNIVTNCDGDDGQIIIASNTGTEIDAWFTDGFGFDNNNYFLDGQSSLGSYNKDNLNTAINYATLALWQAAVPAVVDRNSTDIDPKFVDKNLNWKLLGNSPAIDTGTDIGVYAEDIDGIPRPKDNRWDKGAYEHDQVQ